MSRFNVYPKKPSPQISRLEPSVANENDARDLGYTDNSGKAVKSEPSRTPHQVGSAIVRRDEKDDED